MTTKYQLAVIGTGEFTAAHTIPQTMEILRHRLARRAGPPHRVRDYGGADDFGPEKSTPEVIRNIRGWMRRSREGGRLVIDSATGPTYVLKRIETDPPLPDIEGHPAIRLMWGLTRQEFGPVVWYSGSWLCRYIDGTRTVSHHGYLGDGWKGGAVDSSTDYAAELEDVSNFQVDRAKHHPDLQAIDMLLVFDRQWTRQGGWGSSSAAWHSHTHLQVAAGRACSP
jgi:hypothetical protein